MHRTRRLALALAAAFAAGGTVSPRADAQDDPPPPLPPRNPVPAEQEKAPRDPADAGAGTAVPPAAAEPAPTDEEDAAARKIVEAAADRQGGKSLAAPEGRIESFRVAFHKIKVFRTVQKESGETTRTAMESGTPPGLVVLWKQGQIRTEMRLEGDRPVIRGVRTKAKADGTLGELPWLWDGTEARVLVDTPDYAKDRDELDRDRTVVKALLDVAVLRSMLADGSRWRIVQDAGAPAADGDSVIDAAAFRGVALRRTPPANAETKVHLTLWVDAETKDVTAACVRPAMAGGSTMYYTFKYHAEFPKVKGDVLRFPFEVGVVELPAGETKAQPVMVAKAGEASFNDLTDEDFKPPVK